MGNDKVDQPVTRGRIWLAYLVERHVLKTFATRTDLSYRFLWQILARYRKVSIAVINKLKPYIEPDEWFNVISAEPEAKPDDFLDDPSIVQWLHETGKVKLADELYEEWVNNRAPRS